MKYNKGFAPIMVLLVVLGVLAVGGTAYFMGKNSAPKNEVVDTSDYVPVTEGSDVSVVTNDNTQAQSNSCLVITSPAVNQIVSFPMTITGYLDVSGAQNGTCTKWSVFENEAGRVLVKDSNGNIKSSSVIMKMTTDYYAGIQQWPFTSIIQNLTGIPYTSEIGIHMTDNEQRDGFAPQTQALFPLEVIL